MTAPTAFTARTARFDLPMLFSGQAQKEFTVNEALSRIAALLHPVIEGELSAPPAAPEDGQCWLVGSAPSGEWAGHDSALACWSANSWLFVPPQTGLRCFDASSAQSLFFDGTWRRLTLPAAPDGGSVQDTEARNAIAGLIAALSDAGIG